MLTFSLPFFLLFFTTTTIAQPYKATDLFFIDCGSSTASSSNPDQRWVSDENSKFMSSNIDTTSITFTSDLNETPYSTARVFYASFNYAFPVSLGPKYLRLHFYPATNSQLNTESFLFSVSSNGYSLLTNFSAFQAAFFIATTRSDAGVNGPQVRPFIKEFLIYVKDTQILNVTITPSRNSFAFINGIEIVSMPENLYFNTTKTKYLNQLTTVIDNHKALENIYRLNMGGSQIPVHNDTGMYRSWDQDSYYMNGTEVGVKPLYNNSIMYTMETPNYIAPELVYQTQRSMGRQTNNLTWILPVDSGFYHMLRLHFCNIIPQYNKSGVVVFSILINNQTAEQRVDLFNWTQGTGYPVFKDYMVFVHDPNGKRGKQDLWLVMHPNPLSELYFDAYLNGLEVFKLSLDKSLASPNPELSITTTRTKTVKDNNKKKETPYVVIIGGIVEALVLLPIIAFIVIRQRRRLKHYGATKDISSYRCRCFSLKEVKTATEEFNENFIIGNGGFGKVYKGCLDNATTVVAIKQLDSSSRQGFQEFRTKIEMLSKLRHVQLVSLIGYCDDEGEMILVYDYMAHGTLREHLYNTNNPPLSWKRRLDICIGVAKGLHYLHSGGKRVVIHGDVKSTNILLDENWVAKLSDFGLSKLGSEDHSETYINTEVKGSLGYIDPEYCWTQQLTKKSDVYSFGVVLLEVLCARPVIVAGLRDEQVSLVEWTKTCYQNGNLLEIIDPNVSGEIAPGCLRKFGEVASKCLHEEGSERPAMEEVVWRLEFALQLQEDADKMDGLDIMEKEQELHLLM